MTDRSALRALRLGLARAAGAGFDLPLAVIGAAQARGLQPDAVARLDDSALIIVLDGPDGARGAMQLDAVLASGIVQQQTMGTIGPDSADDPERTPTATDAALVAPLLDDAMQRAEDLVEVASDRACISGYRFGAQAESARSLGLGFVADRYRIFDLSVDLGGGLRKGQILLILPEPTPAPPPTPDPQPQEPVSKDSTMLALPTRLTAELARFQVALSDAARWQPGDLLALPIGADLSRTRLVTPGGEVVAVLQLGQARGARALRLPPDPASLERAEVEDAGADFSDLTPTRPPVDPAADPGPVGSDADTVGGAGGADDLLASLDLADQGLGDGDDVFARLSPEEAAAEISELAGLPARLAHPGTPDEP
ncbi:MAG: hypothetical protein OIF47_12670 [Marinibacterium sp.]|nr:hypothetical protein [Marinibacterium sp.]